MSVKFIRTCNRCGKVIEERNDTLSMANHLPSTKSTSLEFHKANADGMYDLCEDCWEDFCQFMRGQLVCDISDREKDVDAYNGESFKRATEEECQAFAEEKSEQDGWSPEIRELVREHNKKFQEIKDAEKKHIIDTADENASKIAENVMRNYVATEANFMDKSKIQLKPGAHTYHRWTEEEDAFLMEKKRSNAKTPEMAKELGLSVTQVRNRIEYLNRLRKEKENAKSESDEVVYGLDGTVYTKDKDGLGGWTGWSPEALDLARQHNESCEEPKATKVSTTVDKSKIKLAPGTHTYHHWTAEEDRAILNSSGKTLNDLACQFGTTIAAVRARKNLILNGKVDIHRED